MFPSTPLQLYRMPISGHCHRVELMLSLLGLPYELIDVNLLRGEHQRAEFLALNRFGQVPVIEDRGMREWTQIGFSSIYFVLGKLEKLSLVTSKKPAAAKPILSPLRKVK